MLSNNDCNKQNPTDCSVHVSYTQSKLQSKLESAEYNPRRIRITGRSEGHEKMSKPGIIMEYHMHNK